MKRSKHVLFECPDTRFPQAAQEQRVYVIGGSIPERDGDRLYNTSTVFNPMVQQKKKRQTERKKE